MEFLKIIISVLLAAAVTTFSLNHGIEVNIKDFTTLILVFYALLTGIHTDAIISLISNFKQRVAFKWTN